MSYTEKIQVLGGPAIIREKRCCRCGVPTNSHKWDGSVWCHTCWVAEDMESVMIKALAEREKVRQKIKKEWELEQKQKEAEENETNKNKDTIKGLHTPGTSDKK